MRPCLKEDLGAPLLERRSEVGPHLINRIETINIKRLPAAS